MKGHFEEIFYLPSVKTQVFNKHILVTGKSGSGKSNTGEYILANKIGKEKCIDLVDRGRHENMLFSLPERKAFLVNKLKALTGRKPTGFNHEAIMVAGSRLQFIKKLPANIKVRSLDEESFNLSDMFYLFGNSQPAKNLLGEISYRYGNMNVTELKDFLENYEEKGVHSGTKFSILRAIRRWLGSGLFSDQFPVIDLKKILKDKKRLTSFSTFLLEDESEEALFYGTMLKKILDMKRRGHVRNPIRLYIREIAFAMSRDGAEQFQYCQKQLMYLLREGRDYRISLLADTQRFRDLLPTFRRQFGTLINMKSDKADAEALNEISDVPPYIISQIPKFKVGEGIITTGSQFFYPVFFAPSRNLHKKPNMNVLGLLGKVYGFKKYDYKLNIINKETYRPNSKEADDKTSKESNDNKIDNMIFG